MAEPMVSPSLGKSPTLAQMEELIEVLDHGGATSCDEVAAARTLEMMLGLHVSHRLGSVKVRFPLEDRAFAVDTA